jgi:hypothetical protein
MKKAIALLVALSFLSVSVFAAPLAAASAMSSVTIPGTLTEDSLFADVGATPLTDEEAMLVEGEGGIGAFLGFCVGLALSIPLPSGAIVILVPAGIILGGGLLPF